MNIEFHGFINDKKFQISESLLSGFYSNIIILLPFKHGVRLISANVQLPGWAAVCITAGARGHIIIVTVGKKKNRDWPFSDDL